MAAALRYADDSRHNPQPPELEMLWLIDRFGWEAAHRAPKREIKRMLVAENIYKAVQQRKAAEGQEGGCAKWVMDNPALAAAFERAVLAASAEDDE